MRKALPVIAITLLLVALLPSRAEAQAGTIGVVAGVLIAGGAIGLIVHGSVRGTPQYAAHDCRKSGVTRFCLYDGKGYSGQLVSLKCDGWTVARFTGFAHKASSIINKCRAAYVLSGRPGTTGRAPLRARTIYPLQWIGDLGGAVGMDNLNETLRRR